MWQLIGSGDRTNLDDVTSLEQSEIPEGGLARLSVVSEVPIGTWEMDALHNILDFAGIDDLAISGSGLTLNITWRKGFPWAAIIILALVAVIVIAAWQFFKDQPVAVTSTFIIGGAILAVAVAYTLFRRKY